MKIGLMRHFKVDSIPPKFMASKDFIEWVHSYDSADIIANEVNMPNIEWNKCYSSDLPRAVKTAQAIFRGEILITEQLREVPLAPVFGTSVKLHYMFWNVIGRIAWLFSHKSQAEGKRETQVRIREFLDSIKNEEALNILIVCHGFLMNFLQRELSKRGFKGSASRNIRNGKLYLFEK